MLHCLRQGKKKVDQSLENSWTWYDLSDLLQKTFSNIAILDFAYKHQPLIFFKHIWITTVLLQKPTKNFQYWSDLNRLTIWNISRTALKPMSQNSENISLSTNFFTIWYINSIILCRTRNKTKDTRHLMLKVQIFIGNSDTIISMTK